MRVKFIHCTPEAEKHIAYCARVSSSNQDNPEFEKLLTYLIKHKHWSPMEMATMCVEINTSRAIAAQILRHRSFSIQEFSQRYSKVDGYEPSTPRRQDLKNKQNSIDDLSEENKDWFNDTQSELWRASHTKYNEALSKGIAKEIARDLLPLSTSTKLYMHGSIRSWITYLMVRMDASTQKEHRDIAIEIWNIFKEQFPTISKTLNNVSDVFKDGKNE
jgi:thymidylate synthase (FAD)